MSKLSILFSLCAILLFASCKTTQSNNGKTDTGNATTTKKAFIPYSVGSFWVYEYIDHQNKGAEPFVDTLKVLNHEKTEEGLKVNLNQAKWMIRGGGDSIFVFCQGRGGGGFSMPQYHRTETPNTYGSCKGDVVIQVTVSKLAEPVTVNGTSYKNCYQYEMKPYERVIVADGIGVIKKEFYGVDNKLATEQLLVNYGIK